VLGDPKNQANIKTSLANLAKATAKATEAMDALKSFATEASKTAAETRRTIADARKTVATAGQTATRFSRLAENADRRVEELTAKLIEDAEKLSTLLTAVNKMTRKVESGEGTAGRLINDPKLYNSLLEASDQLTELTKEFRRLLEHWKKHGVPIKLK